MGTGFQKYDQWAVMMPPNQNNDNTAAANTDYDKKCGKFAEFKDGNGVRSAWIRTKSVCIKRSVSFAGHPTM